LGADGEAIEIFLWEVDRYPLCSRRAPQREIVALPVPQAPASGDEPGTPADRCQQDHKDARELHDPAQAEPENLPQGEYINIVEGDCTYRNICQQHQRAGQREACDRVQAWQNLRQSDGGDQRGQADREYDDRLNTSAFAVPALIAGHFPPLICDGGLNVKLPAECKDQKHNGDTDP
jgi:hypothetical protein